MIPYASVKPGRTGFDTEAGVRRSISLFETLLTTQVAGGPRLRRAHARRARPLVLGTLGKGIMRHGWLRPIAGGTFRAPRPSDWSPSGPTGSAAVHAGPSPSSYTTHIRQAPSEELGPGGDALAPAGFRVGAGHGALIETSLTRGGVAAQATSRAPTGRTNPAEVPGGPGGRVSARRVRAAVVAIFPLQRCCAQGRTWVAGFVAG